MEEFVLDAVRRETIGKQVKALRREGKLPAVIYGRYISPTTIILDTREASRLLNQLGPSALVAINLDDERHVTLVREKQRNALTGEILHVDFQAVSMLEKLRTSVGIEFVGEAPAVEIYNGILVQETDLVEVESLPGNLPERFVVDLSILKEIGDAIYLKDILAPEGVEILDDMDSIVAIITAPVVEMLEEELEEGAAEPEVIEKGKQEEEEF
jgi:large subunit ribosomal protein L25